MSSASCRWSCWRTRRGRFSRTLIRRLENEGSGCRSAGAQTHRGTREGRASALRTEGPVGRRPSAAERGPDRARSVLGPAAAASGAAGIRSGPREGAGPAAGCRREVRTVGEDGHDSLGTLGRNHGARLHAAVHARSEGQAVGASRPAGDPGLLPRRLEPRLRRPDGALQRAARGVRALQGPAPRDLRRWVLVPRGLRHGSQAAFPAVGRFRAEGRGGAPVWRLSGRGRVLRAGALCHRCRRRRSLVLRLSRRRESWRRRHSRSAREDRHGKGDTMSRLTPAVSESDHRAGPDDAPVTLVEYGDYECPHCGGAYPIVREVQRRMGRGLRLVFRNFPLAEMHPHAVRAAEAAEAAAVQDKFWEMHDLLFEHQAALDDSDLMRYAKTLALDTGRVKEELAAGTHARRVRQDFRSGVRSGVNGTPTFFINGARHDGPWDLEALLEVLERASRNL